jgi:RNA polymerase sigma factor (sigma-70 family)
MSRDLSNSFQCPLCSSCYGAHGEPFPSYRAANEAVARYQSCTLAAERRRQADQLYLRYLPLVRKTLARVCLRSRCYPGVCIPEELMGETYPIFQQSLDDYDPSLGVDFVGYVSQRLRWGLQHCARRLEKTQFRSPPPQVAEDPIPGHIEEERVLDRVMAHDLLSRLGSSDALLIGRYAAGHSCGELAEAFGITSAAVRKRLERLRTRLRALAEAG